MSTSGPASGGPVSAEHRHRWIDSASLRQMLSSAAFAGAAAAILVATTQVTARILQENAVRIRDLDVLVLLRIIAEVLRLDMSQRAPDFVNRVHDMTDLSQLLIFAGGGIAVITLIYLITTLLFLVVAIPCYRAGAGLLSRRTARLMRQALPVVIFSFFTSPLFFPLIESHLFPGTLRHQAVALVGGALLLCTCILAAAGFIKRPIPGRATRTVAVCGSALAILMLVLGQALSEDVKSSGRVTNGPNVLLISVDTLRPDHLGCYGYQRNTSPAIDSLARDGVRFSKVVSPTSWTLPAHMSLLSGLPSEAHGVVDDGMKAGSDVLFLSEVLQDAGYETAGFVAAPYLSGRYGFLQGFDHYDDYSVAEMVNRRSHEGVTSPKSFEMTADWLTTWAARPQANPFFVFLHLWDVHYDFTPPPPYDSMFDPSYTGTVTGHDFQDSQDIHPAMAPRDLQHLIALYDGEIRYTDSYVKRLLDVLRELDVLEDTMIVLTSDHGEEFFEHGHKGHRQNLFDETILVPLIIRWPEKLPRGRTIAPQVTLLDVAPTILSLVGLERPVGFGTDDIGTARGGEDLTPLILDGLTPHVQNTAFSDLHGELKAIRSNTEKLIRDTADGADTLTYFNLVDDPGETQDVLGRYPERASRLRAALNDWLGIWSDYANLAEPAEVGEDVLRRLRRLGYVR